MKKRSHPILGDLVGAAELAGVVVFARIAAPVVLTWLANRFGKRVPGFQVHVGRVDIEFLQPGLKVRELAVDRVYGGLTFPLARIDTIQMASDWGRLLRGRLVGWGLINEPRISLDLRQFPAVRAQMQAQIAQAENPSPKQLEHHKNGIPKDSRPKTSRPISQQLPAMQDRIKRLPPVTLARGVMRQGDIRISGIPEMEGIELHVAHIDAAIENVTNEPHAVETALMHMACTARVLDSGYFAVHAEGYPLVYPPTFDMDMSVKQIDLSQFRPVVPKFVPIDLLQGFANLFVEAGAARGHLRGYAKPVVDNLKLATLKHRGMKARLKGLLLKIGARIVRNKGSDRIATRVDFDGPYDHPQLRIKSAIRRFLRNAFMVPERPLLENRVWLLHPSSRARDAQLQYLGERPHNGK